MQHIYIGDEGKGFPLVLVHGFLGSSKMWEPQINFFKDYFRVITPDLPGFGKSNKAKSHNNIQSIANLLLDCLEEKKIDKFFKVKIFTRGTKILLIKNTKFNFLKNLKIFPMEEISRPKSLKKSLNFKMSNMNMNINIKVMRGMNNIENSSWIEQTKFNSYTLPTFTKKIFSSLGKYL